MSLITPSSLDFPTQLVVLGRGMNEDGSIGELTEQRALAVHEMGKRYLLDVVIFCGKGSTLAVDKLDGRTTEAEAMAEVADLSDDVRVILETESTTTSENFIESYEYIKANFNPEKSIGMVAHMAHLPRAYDLGRRALGKNARIISIPVEEFGAPSEGLALTERVNNWVSFVSCVGVWGMESFQKRDAQVKGVKQSIKGVLGATVLKNNMQYN